MTSVSPELSPSTAHHSANNRHKKRSSISDELNELANASSAIDDDCSQRDGADDKPDTIITRLFVTPVMALSFIFSLLFVTRQERAWRVSQHGSTTGSRWSKLSIWSWLDPNPYQDPQDSTWNGHTGPSDHVAGTRGGAPVPAFVDHKAWVTNKKHREMANLEIGDALEMRGKMAIAMIVSGLMILLGTVWLMRCTYTRFT